MAGGGPRGARTAAGAPSAAVPLLGVLGVVAVAAAITVAVWGLATVRSASARTEAVGAARDRAVAISAQMQAVRTVVELFDVTACAASSDPTAVVPRRVPTAPVPQGAAVHCVASVDGAPVVPAEGDVPILDVDDAIRVALAQARDTGGAVLAAPSASPRPAVVAAAIYRRDGGLVGEPPAGTFLVDRSEVAGYVLALVDLTVLLGEGERPWELVDGSTVLASPGEIGEAAHADVEVLGRRWTVRAEVENLGWRRPYTITAIALGAIGVALLSLADRRRRRALELLTEGTRRAEERAATVRSLAGIVQESQGVDEILPALAVRLSDELMLAGVSLSVSVVGGDEREVFVHGDPPDRSCSPGGRRRRSLRPGETMAFDLHRADRSIAVLRIVAGGPIDPEGLDLVQLTGEMVTSAIVSSRSLEQQQEAVSRLQSLDELKTTFLGVASHELRTPATAISGLASLLAERWDVLTEGDRRAFADRIATNADALNALVQDLLDFARLERGDFALALGEVDLSEVVDAVLTRLDSVWASHAVERTIEPRAVVFGDVNALERIITNLVSNAVKFSPDGAPVAVVVERDDARVRLIVDDAGPGVPVEERERIFVRFFRGSGDAVVRTRGVGIGLSIVRDFVAQMGGTVRVEDSPAGGARFVVELAAFDRTRRGVVDVAST